MVILPLLLLATSPLIVPASTVATATPASTPSIGFAPPIDRVLRYRVTRVRNAQGRPQRATMIQCFRFTHMTAGYRLESWIESIGLEGTDSNRRSFEAMMRSQIGLVHRFTISADGRSMDVIDPESTWAPMDRAYRHALAVAEADPDRSPQARQAIRRHFEAVLALSPEARRERLLDTPRTILFATPEPPLTTGEQRSFTIDGSATDGTTAVSGKVTLTSADGNAAAFTIETRTPMRDGRSAPVIEHSQVRISLSTGLVTEGHHVVEVGDDPAARTKRSVTLME